MDQVVQDDEVLDTSKEANIPPEEAPPTNISNVNPEWLLELSKAKMEKERKMSKSNKSSATASLPIRRSSRLNYGPLCSFLHLFRMLRGLNIKARRKDAKDHIFNLKPSFVALIEIKIKVNKMQRFLSCLPGTWSHKTNHDHCIGG